MNRAGIILAAGLSSRMGRSKPLLEYQGQTFLNRMADLLRPYADPIIAVLGHDKAHVRAVHAHSLIHMVDNPRYQEGQLTSLQTGLAALPPDTTHVLFTPVDLPQIRPDTLIALADACDQHAHIVLPRYAGKRGHPVCIDRQVAADILALPADSRANLVIDRYAAEARYVDVDDPGICRDIDLPAEYEALLAQERHS